MNGLHCTYVHHLPFTRLSVFSAEKYLAAQLPAQASSRRQVKIQQLSQFAMMTLYHFGIDHSRKEVFLVRLPLGPSKWWTSGGHDDTALCPSELHGDAVARC